MVRDAAAFRSADLAFDSEGSANPWYYEMPELGYNYRLSDIHAALAHSQLGKLKEFSVRRRKLAGQYDELLAPLTPIVRPVPHAQGCDPVLHLYVVHIDFAAAGTTRSKVMNLLREAGIGTQVHYIPVHMQPYYHERYGNLELPGARTYYESCLSLPLFPAMAEGDVGRVVDALGECLK
jgi:dTDP-4-amino-4,6-dideoxygalactose transaminase